jgi:Tol biopolymer transport system component
MKIFPRSICAFLFLFLSFEVSFAQDNYQNFYFPVHRPQGLNWQQLKTDHFRIIYPDFADSLAFRAATILENQYPKAVALSGGSLKNFPVIISTYNDLSNGFVTPTNFRSEFDAAPFKGKAINPKSGDWFEAVLPHELLHATHGSLVVPLSIPALYGIFSPDIARSFNFFPPVGVHEGLAVHHESENIAENGGRKNYTFFNNQYNARISSNDPWSPGQTFQVSRYTLPYNRHYISGSTFTEWLHEKYGEDISKKAIRFQHKYFFLGYGFALKHVTGKWPRELYSEYTEDKKALESDRQDLVGDATATKQLMIDTPYKGVTQRKPFWTSGSELVFYSVHYNAPRGFYTYDLNSKKTSRIAEINTVSDYNIDYDRASNSLLFAEYDADLLYSSAFKSELKRLDLDSKKQFEITEKDRVYSPTISGSKIIALQTDGGSANIISIDGSGAKTLLASFDDATPISIKANPNSPDQLALIVNRRGVQALWITTPETVAEDILQSPRVAFKDASIFDIDWHPKDQKLLFTADSYPAMNIYELNLTNGDILQKTNSLFNAFEASYSPDASSIAYVVQQNQEQRIAILNEEDFYDQRVPRDALLSGSDLRDLLDRPLLGAELSDESKSWETKKYRAGLSWLKPRALLPIIRENSGSSQIGANLQSIDALSSQSYNAEITGIQNRLWYDLTYTNKTFWPGFRFKAYSDPSFGVLGFQNSNPRAVMLQERGFELSIPVNFIFNGTTRGKSLFLSPSISAEQIRYYDLSPSPISDFETQYKAGGLAQLTWNILTQRRDIQPSSGISLFGFLDKALNDPVIGIENSNGMEEEFLLANRWAAYYGIISYVSPLKKLNQSLRYDIQFLNQSRSLLYSRNTIIPESFTDDAFVFDGTQNNETYNNLGRFSTRYTIPVAYPSDGGMLVPFYLQAIYLSAFSHTITNLEQNSAKDLFSESRSVFGAGLHFQFNISNITFDLGIGLSYEPTRNNTKLVFGEF